MSLCGSSDVGRRAGVFAGPLSRVVLLVAPPMPDDAADLQRALEFVISRVEEEAHDVGEPLSEDEKQLLRNLPSQAAFGYWRTPTEPFIPRDFVYERLCSVARSAYRRSPSPEWRFCAAVLKLNRHPMLWLLWWAGAREPRPWWDRWSLIASGLLLVALFIAGMLVADHFDIRFSAYAAVPLLIAAFSLLWYAVSKLETWQARRAVEEYRARD